LPNRSDSIAARVGSLAWMQRTDGILRSRDRLRLLGQAMLLQAHSLPGEVRRRLGLRTERLARFDVGELRLPDSGACRQAEAICAQAPSMIVNHSYRSYVWAAILAAHDGMSHDEEVVYVASLLHDIAYAEPQRLPDGRPCCFTKTGADAALSLEWDEGRRREAAEAITLHLNLYVGRKEGPEAYLVGAGTRLDATGFRNWDLHPHTVEAVLARYPRENLKEGFTEMMSRQASATPGSRCHFYTRYLGANYFIRRAPFDE
jgi:hypothetical protein